MVRTECARAEGTCAVLLLLQVVTAALAGRWTMVEKLVQLGADVHAEDAATGATLLLMAARSQQWPLVRYLLDCTDADVDDVDRHGAPCCRRQRRPHCTTV